MAMARRGGRDGGKAQFWRRVLRDWRGSDLTIRDFCTRRGLSEPSFYAWRRTLAERDQAARGRPVQRDAAAPLFVPVRVTAVVPVPVEVVLGSGRVIRVLPGFDAATVRQLVAVLEEGPSC
jgi:hypothetical protein